MINSNKNYVELLEIEIQNFLSIEYMKFDFTNHKGINYVFGYDKDVVTTNGEYKKNGAGKTSLFEAIVFLFYGKTLRDIKKTSIVNRLKKKSCLVSGKVRVGEDIYTITSGSSPTIASIKKNEEDISVDANGTYDYILKNIIKRPFDIFSNSEFLSITESNSLFKMKKDEKRKFIEKLFSFADIGIAYKNVCEDKNKIDREITANLAIISKYKTDIEDFQNRDMEFDTVKQKEIDVLNTKLASLKENLKSVEKKIADFGKIESTEDVLKEMDKLNNDLKKLATAISNAESQINLLNSNSENSKKLIKKYETVLTTVCGDCHSKLNDILKTGDAEKLVKTNEESVTKLEQNLEKMTTLNRSLIAKLGVQRQLLNDINSKTSTYNNFVIRKSELAKDINVVELDIKKTSEKKSDYVSLIEKSKDSMNKIQKIVDGQIDDRKYLDYMKYLFSEDGIKKKIVSNIIELLNERIKRYLNRLSAEYTVVFSPDFEAEFLTTTGTCEFDSFSAGEKKSVELASVLALKDLLNVSGSVEFNFLICDEFLDSSIDDIAVRGLINILREMDTNKSMFVISYREAIQNQTDFDHIIEVEKKNGFTRIVKQ